MSNFCLVRQPVFGANGSLLGYEIRYEDVEDTGEAFGQLFQNGTFDLIRANLPAFLVCAPSQVISAELQQTDPSNLILLLPSSASVATDVLEALTRFRDAGGRIGLDGVREMESPSEALLPLASWIRLDIPQRDAPTVCRIRERLTVGNKGIKLLAYRVDSEAEHKVARECKADAYQGTFFSRAESVPTADLPQSSVSAIRLLGLARDPNVNDRTLEEVLETDPVLTFQLLQLVNSAAIGMRGVASIGQALRLIGRTTFQRWLAVAVAASRNASTDVDHELVRQAVARGRLLEQLTGGSRDAGTLFLVGLFSLLDTVFRIPLHEILERVALSEEATEALLDRTGPYADALSFAESYELGMFESAAELAEGMGIDPDTMTELYTNALQWTTDALGAMGSGTPTVRA